MGWHGRDDHGSRVGLWDDIVTATLHSGLVRFSLEFSFVLFIAHPFIGRNSMLSDISRFTFRPGTDIFSAFFFVSDHRPYPRRSEMTGLESHDIWDGFLSRGGFFFSVYHMFPFPISVPTWSFGC